MYRVVRADCPYDCCTEGSMAGGYCYVFFHHKHLVGISYALILLARLCRLPADGTAGSALWWLDTALLLWVVLLLSVVTGRRWGKLAYAKACVMSLTAFHFADLVISLLLSAGTGHFSWQHTAVIVLFTLFSVGPTLFLLWCDTHHYLPAARVLHAVTGARIVILMAEAALYLLEIINTPSGRLLLGLSAALTLAGHILYEVALAYLVDRIHRVENIEKSSLWVVRKKR